MTYLDFSTIIHAVAVINLMPSGQTLECFNCEEFKMNGKVSDQYSTPCAGSAVTCHQGDLCMTSEYSFIMMYKEQDIKGEYKGTQCSKEIGEDEECRSLKSALTNEFDETLADFKCKVRFCDTDTNGGTEKTSNTSFLVAVFLVVFHGLSF